MLKVIIESPYGKTPLGETVSATELARNVTYARRCMADSLARGEAPFASHLLYTQVLDDNLAMQRKLGMDAGFAWMVTADKVVIYEDYPSTPGMDKGLERAKVLSKVVEFRSIGKNPPITSYAEGLGDK